MITESEEPPNSSKATYGGQVQLDSLSSPSKAARPYAGADDSMIETLGTTNIIPQQSPCRMPKPELLVGDLVWSKIPGHAWWPSMVSYEPNKAVYFQSSGRGKTCFKYHVQFFGDEPQRGWVSDKNMIKFTGGDPFADLPNSAKRDKIPQSKQLRAWERALEQAQKALPLNRQQRKLCYVFKYNDDLQKAPKQSRSPEPAYKRKEKASKKQTKVRARLTRRSCLLDRSKELMQENDSIESLCSPKDLTSELSIDGKSRDSSTPDDISCDVKVEDSAHSPESVGLRRRGRSAGNLSIDGSFVFDAVHVHTKLKEDRKNSSIMSFSKAELADNEFVSVSDVKDFKLAKEKVKISRMPDSLQAKGLARKRQREHEKDSIMKAAKKIKVEIVTRKHNVFEIIPKKMKNKQTQTPERKAKRGVATKKKVKRKREISRRTIKTKETSASKKFSRKLKSVSNEKGLIKKGLRENRNKRKKEIREASSNCAIKRSVRDRKSPRKRSCSGYEAQSNEDIEYINDVSTNKQILLETKFQSIDIMEGNMPKRRRGRPRKIQTDSNDDGMAHGMILTDAALSENPAGKSSCRDAHLKGSLNPVDGVKISESVDQEVKKKTKSSNMGSTGDCLEGRKLRRNKIELPYGDVDTPVKKIGDKPAREPSRRSSRHIVASQNDENECVVVCRVSQLPEIDDIVVGNSENNSRVNGINGCVNKRLLLEVLSNIDAEIPIVFEGTEDRTTLSRLTAEGSSNAVLQRNSPGHSESNVCTNLKLPLDVTNASHRSPACTVANVEDGNGLELSTSNKDIVENYQCVISDENLSACSMVEPNSKHVNCETYSPKTSLLFAHEDSSCKPYVPVSDLDGFGNDGLISNTQSSQDSCVSRLEMGNANPVASSPDLVTGSEIEPTHVDINAPRAFANSSNLGGFMNDEDGHEYFGNDGADRSNANTVFSRDRLNHVEDTDLYLNDDDIGLPVTKNSQSCALTSSGSDNYPTPYCREMEPSGLLNKVCNVASQFGKSTLDVSGLEDYQPVFSIPSLTLPELTQSASYYQRRLENPCSVISTVSNTSTNSDHISSRYFPIHEAFTEPVAPDTNAGVEPTAPHSFGQCETLSGQLGDISRVNCSPLKSVNNPAISGACVNDASCGIIQQGQCQTGLVRDERGSLIASSMNGQVGDEAILQGVSQDIVDNSTDDLQAHHGDNYIGCDLSENKQTLVPVTLDGPAETQVSLGCHGSGDIDNNNQATLSYHSNRANENNSQATLSCNDNGNGSGEIDNGNPTCVSKQDCYSDGKCELTENDSVLLDGQNSPLNSHSLSTLANHNSPTMHESILRESITMRENCSNDEDLHEPSTTATQEYSPNETQEADSTTLSANSSISERQSPNEEDSGVDSAKVVDDSSQAGNSLKRQRKRKTMSDFHVGLAFDEILSNRGRASDGDKGVSKLSLAKKKRDYVKRIDYEEKVRPVKDPEVAEQVEVEEDGQLKEMAKGQCRGRIEDGKRLAGKKRCVSTSEEQGGIDESATLNVDTRRMEETVTCTQRVSSDLNGPVIESVPEKKKRGRKPKVKKDREKCLVGKQVDNSIPVIDGEKVDMVNDVEPSLRNSAVVQGVKTKKKSVDKLRKKTTKSQTSKLKRSNDENKPKRKYVKRKHSQKVAVPGKVEISQSKKKIDELLQTQIDSAVILTESKCPSVGAVEHETKPKRPYNRRKKPTNDALGDSNKNIGKKIDRKYDKKSKVKRKRGRPESLDNSDVANRVGKKVGRKRKSSKIGCESISDESPLTVVLGWPRKYKKKTSALTEADNRPNKASGARNQSKGEKLFAQIEDVAGKCNSSRIADETTSGLENVIDAKLDGDSNLLRPPLPIFDSKKVKRNDKLETRSNFSDETASISGRETDESGKNKKESICTICEQGDCLLVCNGVCYSSFHPDCLGLSTVPEKFYCDECLTGNHSCFLCKETGNLRKCSFPMCGKYYHDACTQKMRGCRLDNSRLICPLHSCGTCTNDKENSSTSKKRLLRCVRCPTAYHASRCLVAGCMQLTNTLMVCNRHFVPQKSKPHHAHYNVSWCFVCSTGGMLVCCDSCPAAFHPGCVEDLDGVPDETWQCDSCREGKKPLYGDLVWVKYGFWRWWPARICFPDEIPTRIQKLPHDVGEFPVMFFGSRDYCWLHAGRVFPYQEGDKGCRGNSKNGTNKIFEKAIREVEEAHRELKEMQDKQMEQKLAKQSKKPPPYKQIKVNKYISALRNVIGPSEFTHCECSLSSENPCGPGSECINRMLQIECDRTCRGQDKCQNQRFQKCQQVDCVPVKTAHCGWGLKTRQGIKKGDFVIEYVGELIDEATCRKRINDYHDQGICDYYFLVIDKDNIIDAYPKGNASRFMNHCCDPNCDTQKWTVNGEIRVGLFANKDIEAGSELTFNYNLDTLGNEKKVCHCGSKNCSGFLGVRPKTQNAIALKEKKKKEKQKKKRKKDKAKIIRHEDECFACGDGGELIMCDRSSCSKCYHLKCLTLPDMPKGKWDCPWHFCDVCGKRASYYCNICPNSFCVAHHAGEVIELSKGVFVCDEHTHEEITEEKNRLLVLQKTREEQTLTNEQNKLSDNSSLGKT